MADLNVLVHAVEGKSKNRKKCHWNNFDPGNFTSLDFAGQKYIIKSMKLGLTLLKRAITRFIFPAILLALFLPATTGYSFTALYVFGDSISDTGRNPPAPGTNYYEGRYSNGPLWVEYLSPELGIPYNPSNNFAVSGSTTSDLLSQIAGLTPSANLKSGLFTLISGGNDFLDGAQELGTDDAAWGILITNTVENLTNAISAIYTNGGREIIVGNLANLGRTPSFLGTPNGYSNYVDSKVAIFNLLLASGLTNVVKYSPGLRLYALNALILPSPTSSVPRQCMALDCHHQWRVGRHEYGEQKFQRAGGETMFSGTSFTLLPRCTH